MANATYIRDMIEQELLNVHTGFVGKVVKVNGELADIQPLSMSRTVGGAPQQAAVVISCPIIKSCVSLETFNCQETGQECARVVKIKAGDVVFCMCADRDISETRTGAMAVPVAGHHDMSSAVVVGIL